MIFFKHKKWVAMLAVFALALTLPAFALAADDTAPTGELYSPTVNAAATANQKIIFSLSEKVALVSGVEISVSDGSTSYTADAGSGTVVGNAIGDRWYAVYDLTDFTSGGTALSLAPSKNYTVNAQAGAFKDTAENLSGAISGSFGTISDAAMFAVVFTTSSDGQGAKAGGTPIVSGQAVTNGANVAFTIPSQDYYDVHTAIKVGGASGSFTLSGGAVTNDLEVYITRSQVTELSGTPVISGGAYLGKTLSADLSGINQKDLSGIKLKWVLVGGGTETEVGTGDKDKTYAIQNSDVGKTVRLEVSDGTLTGMVSATTDAITKAPYSGDVTKPASLSVTETSVVLTSVPGYEYKRDAGDWQTDTTFSGLTAGTNYDFVQRVKENDTTLASNPSEKITITTNKTVSGLSGNAVITGTAQFGKTLTGSLSGSNGTGTIKYVWQRGGATVGTESTYLLGSADVNQVITVVISTSDQSGSLSAATATVLKADNATVPAPPTMKSNTATSITLNEVPGYQYSVAGTTWQNTTTFNGLVAGATYTFYQRVAESATTLASAKSTGVNFSTASALSGTINTTGEARYGITMTATLSGSSTGTLTYTWKRGSTVVGTGSSYAVGAADIGNGLSVEVTSSALSGVVSKSLGTVAKAYYVGEAPDAPSRSSRTTSKIVLKAVTGCEYSRGGTTWQDSTTFSGLKSGTSYTFYQRYKATSTVEASEPSASYKTSTTASSSGDDEPSATATPKSTPTDGSSTALYSYTLTKDNTRILYATMKSLAEGNKTQDVTIKQENVEFTFPKGTMTQEYTQLWYDFGATINNSIAAQTAQELAGDAYVATVHYNYSGELPGKANIRLNLGAAQAGKTLYYYLLNADNTMTLQQTAVVDSSGFATVSQTHCSDYVFTNRDINTVSPSPSLSPSPEAVVTPLPSPTLSPDTVKEGLGSDGWFIAGIILIAVALIVGGIWLYTKNRADRVEDEDDEDDDKLF